MSLPAGIAKMPLGQFTLFTALGSLPWAAALGVAEYKLGQNWQAIKHYTHPLAYLAVGLIVVFLIFFVIKGRRSAGRGSD